MTAPIAAPPSASRDFITLATWMAGDFSNFKQAHAEPTQFAHIRIFFRPLPFDFFEALGLPGGIGFYSEQVYDYDLWKPYRQGLHRLVDCGGDEASAGKNRIYIENYGFADGVPYAGSGHNRDVLNVIPADCAIRRPGCSMVFHREGEKFIGGVEPGNHCLIPRQGKKTYLVSRVELTENTWESLDQGMDIETHEPVWGSTEGALRFEKRRSFAGELPFDRLS